MVIPPPPPVPKISLQKDEETGKRKLKVIGPGKPAVPPPPPGIGVPTPMGGPMIVNAGKAAVNKVFGKKENETGELTKEKDEKEVSES